MNEEIEYYRENFYMSEHYRLSVSNLLYTLALMRKGSFTLHLRQQNIDEKNFDSKLLQHRKLETEVCKPRTFRHEFCFSA